MLLADRFHIVFVFGRLSGRRITTVQQSADPRFLALDQLSRVAAAPARSGAGVAASVQAARSWSSRWPPHVCCPANYNQVTLIFSDGAGVVNGADVAASFAADRLPFGLVVADQDVDTHDAASAIVAP